MIAGEYPIAIQIFAHHPLISAGKGAPVTAQLLPPVASASGTLVIPKGSRHPHSATLLMDFLLSKEGQHILAAAEYLPVRDDVDPLPQIAPIVPSRAGVEGELRHAGEPERLYGKFVQDRRGPLPLRRAGKRPGLEKMTFAVAVDIGGTFTDLVAYDHDSHRIVYAKSPTTYGNFVEGILDCFNKVQLAPRAASLVNHGTTLVINALIQRKGAKAALVTTSGFRDVLEIARGNRPDPFDLHYRRDDPLIPRQLRFEVTERVGSQGEIVAPLDIAALTPLAHKHQALGVEAVAIFFMNSYANPSARRRSRRGAAHALAGRLRHVLHRAHPGMVRIRTHLDGRRQRLCWPASHDLRPAACGRSRKQGFSGSIYMMGSNGGLLSVERTCRQPVGLGRNPGRSAAALVRLPMPTRSG